MANSIPGSANSGGAIKIDTGLEAADHPSASTRCSQEADWKRKVPSFFAHRCPPEWRGDDSTRTERQTPTGSGSRWRKSLGPAGPNRRRRQSAVWCDSFRDGQAAVIEHRESAKFTDRFAKPKQSPVAVSRTGAHCLYRAGSASHARSLSVRPLLFLLSPKLIASQQTRNVPNPSGREDCAAQSHGKRVVPALYACQRITVAGLTITKAFRMPGTGR